jgi:hypothetical protein
MRGRYRFCSAALVAKRGAIDKHAKVNARRQQAEHLARLML